MGRRGSMLVLCGAALALPAPASAEVKVASEPPLEPRFDPGIADYVTRCDPDEPVRLRIAASDGDRVAVADRDERTGTFSARVRREPGRAVVLRVRSAGRTTTHHVRCLPSDFPDWDADRYGTPQAQWYMVTPTGSHREGYATILNAHGTPVWWAHASEHGPWDVKLLRNGTLAWARRYGGPFGMRPKAAYEVRGLDGKLRRIMRTVGVPTDTHDMQPTPRGTRLMIAYRPREGVDLSDFGGPEDATVFDAEIQELTPRGRLVWSWNSRHHIGPGETTERWWDHILREQGKKPRDKRRYDLVHANSVQPDGDGLIVSARHLNAVFKIDRRTGRLDWKLGGVRRRESLRATRDPLAESPLDGQHDARLHSDRTLTVYDNGTSEKRPPRAVRYRINPSARTAKLLEQVANPEIERSRFVGGARKLPGGNWVVSWGGSPLVTEQTRRGQLVLAIEFEDDLFSYRAVPVPPGRLSAAALRAGMERMDARTRGAANARASSVRSARR